SHTSMLLWPASGAHGRPNGVPAADAPGAQASPSTTAPATASAIRRMRVLVVIRAPLNVNAAEAENLRSGGVATLPALLQLATLSVYDVAAFVPIPSVVVAFGVTFAYPLLGQMAETTDRRSLPFLHRAQVTIGRFLITPAATLVLLTGIYLAARGHLFSKVWVNVGIVAIVVLLGLAG